MTKILFVCMGNICRSPAAEGIMQHLIDKHKLADKIELDSCATHGYHIGHKPDARMQKHASKRDYKLLSIARQFDFPNDFQNFDYIIVMDNDNYTNITTLDGNKNHSQKTHKMTDFCVKLKADEVPDPYYDGAAGFERVLDILEDACEGLLNRICENFDKKTKIRDNQ